MSQTKYKIDNNRRGIVIRFCRLRDEYIKYPDELRQSIACTIDNSKLFIGTDIISDEVRDNLRDAIWYSTCDAKEYPYEVWNLPTISRNEFYERKRKFICSIANALGI